MSWGEAGSFVVTGDPVAQPRPRFLVQIVGVVAGLVRGRAKKARCPHCGRDISIKYAARTYTPKDHPVNAWREAISWEAKRAGLGPLPGPVKLELVFSVRWPGARRGLFLMRHRRPDLDNYSKAVLDALQGLIWSDDGQVAELVARKIHGEAPGLSVRLMTWRDDNGAME